MTATRTELNRKNLAHINPLITPESYKFKGGGTERQPPPLIGDRETKRSETKKKMPEGKYLNRRGPCRQSPGRDKRNRETS